MGWRQNLKKRLRKGKRGGYAHYAKGYQTRGKPRNAPEGQDGIEAATGHPDAPEALTLAHGLPDAEAANPSENLADTQPPVPSTAAPGSGAESGPMPQVELFERPHETIADARLARRAIMRSWEPEPRATQAVLTKAAMMALREDAKLNEVIAVGKLQLDAHGKIMAEEHHNDRMGYHERALQVRAKVGDYVPGTNGPQINVNTGGGPAAVSIFLPAVDQMPVDTIEGDVA